MQYRKKISSKQYLTDEEDVDVFDDEEDDDDERLFSRYWRP